jgi:hypothetical protein
MSMAARKRIGSWRPKQSLAGKHFGNWTVLYFCENRPGYWTCQCRCGNIREVFSGNLTGWKSGGCLNCMQGSPEERFHGHYTKGGGCWEWHGTRTVAGYGQMETGGKKEYAHRFSYRLHYGIDPGEMLVCHHCDNPCCVRPDHLFLGTDKDNMADCAAKGRVRHCTFTRDEHPNSKLTSTQAAAMAWAYWTGRASVGELASKYRVGRNTITNIAKKEANRKGHENLHQNPSGACRNRLNATVGGVPGG